jgi:predicted PurR-regulated permease PerM
MREERVRRAFLLLLVLAITAAFLALIRDFLLTIFLAAIFAGLFHPLYVSLLKVVGGRKPLASALTLLIALLVVVGPLLTVIGIVVNQAVSIAQSARPFVQQWIEQPGALAALFDSVPGAERLAPYREEILTRAGELAGSLGSMLVTYVTQTTRGTVVFFFHFFILLYAMFFFLMDGPGMLRAVVGYMPMREADKRRMLDRFVSVTRATLKGTLLIGALQGSLAGIAFWVVGIHGALFWATVMIVLSVIPAIGAALVWVPATIVLAAQGYWLKALLLAAFCGLIVGSIDNVLRPRLVGRDTQLHDLMILFSTLGGIFMLGPVGFIVGPIVAALFVTAWEIIGQAFSDVLPDRESPIIVERRE